MPVPRPSPKAASFGANIKRRCPLAVSRGSANAMTDQDEIDYIRIVAECEAAGELAVAVDDAEAAIDAADRRRMTGPPMWELINRLIAAKDKYFNALRQPWLDEQKELDRAKFVRHSAARVNRL